MGPGLSWNASNPNKTQRRATPDPCGGRPARLLSKKMPPKNRMRCRAYFLYAPIRTYTHYTHYTQPCTAEIP